MAQGKHIGKVVVAFPKAFVPRRGEPLRPAFAVNPEGCYLITGAFGGFGKVLARWLVEAVPVTSCSPAGAARRRPRRKHLCKTSVSVASRSEWCRRMLARAKTWRASSAEIRSGDRPLKGVFHLAMVIDDAPLASLTRERMRSVMAPKAYGAWLAA